jgi:hypothetical protein
VRVRTRALPIRFRCNCKGALMAVFFKDYAEFRLEIILLVSTQQPSTTLLLQTHTLQ